MATETTPTGSLEEAQHEILGLLSKDEEPETTESTSEPSEAPEAEDSADAPAPEDEASASEAAASGDQEDTPETADVPAPKTYRVKVDGQEVEVTEDELLKGYSRERDYTRKTQQLAEERRQVEAETAKAKAERDSYAQGLQRMEQAMREAMGTEPDWEALKQTLPADQYAMQWIEWQNRAKALEANRQEQMRVQQQQAEEAAKTYRAMLQRESEQLKAVLPDYADPVKGARLRDDLLSFGKTLGFNDQELTVTDHRLVVLLHKAMLFDQQAKKAPLVKNKIEQALAASRPGSRTAAPKPDKLRAAKTRLAQSGSLDDAAAAIGELI